MNYIFITSFNLGGAEKIVSDQLFQNYYSNSPQKFTLILQFNKDKEHSIPPNVNIIRLNGDISKLNFLLQEISYQNKNIVCHLIDDTTINFILNFNIKLFLVIHNDRNGFKNTNEILFNKNIQIISVCDYIKKDLPKNTITIKHIPFLKKIENREYIRNKYNLNDNHILIGMIGRIAEQKDYIYAVELLEKLLKINNNYRLMIVGGHSKYEHNSFIIFIKKIVELKLQKYIIITGFQNSNDFISAFDIGLNTSHFEGMSIACQEMLSYGINVFATDTSGQKEIVAPLNNFFLYEKNDFPFELFNKKALEEKKDYKNSELILKEMSYYSQNQWSLLNSISNEDCTKDCCFITQNLNLGGAQRSLTNLLKNLNYPLYVLNKTEYKNFKKDLINNEIYFFNEEDVFVILNNLFKEISKYKKIIFWNVDTKVKLLIFKFFKDKKQLIDISPGDYMLEDFKEKILFLKSIGIDKNEYFKNVKIINKYKKNDYEPFIYNGVSKYKKQNDNSILKKKIGVFGRLTPSKFTKEIVEVSQKFPDIEFHFYGNRDREGINYNFNENYKNVFFFKPLLEVRKKMIEYDCILVLGINQGCPNTILEALSCNTPVITNNSGGSKETFLNFGEFINKELIDEEDIFQSINNFYKNKNKYIKTPDIFFDIFSMDKFIKNYKNLIKI